MLNTRFTEYWFKGPRTSTCLPPTNTITPRILNAGAKSSQSILTAHSGASKAHDWMVQVLAHVFRTAGHQVRTKHGVTASAGQRRGDLEIRQSWQYLHDQAGSRSLVFDLAIAHDRFGSSSQPHQNGPPSNPQDIDTPLRIAAQRKVNHYWQHYADNHNTRSSP